MNRILKGAIIVILTMEGGACSSVGNVSQTDELRQNFVAGLNFTRPIAGASAAQIALFNAGQDAFEEQETVADGLGPVFNDIGCAVCHDQSGIGGGSER